jgi:hypothetical protein
MDRLRINRNFFYNLGITKECNDPLLLCLMSPLELTTFTV